MPILLAGGLGLVLWWLAAGASAKPKPTPIPGPDATPTDWQKAIADAIAKGDCDNMQTLAEALYRAGMKDAARDLSARAAKCKKDKKPPGGGPGPISPVDAGKAIAAAQALADYIRANKPRRVKGKPVVDSVVQSWQTQEGLVPDGFYGPKTGTRVAVYRVIPPKPWYWPKKNTQKEMNDWKAYMLQRASELPDQRSAWIAASKVP